VDRARRAGEDGESATCSRHTSTGRPRCRRPLAAKDDRVATVTDYIAGMTDRFALKEHQRLTGRSLF
jgi:dGTP triphosphohydrolase